MTSLADGPAVLAQPETGEWTAEAYLHLGGDRIYNPLSDRTIHRGEPGYAHLVAVLSGSSSAEELPEDVRLRLVDEGWLVPASQESDRRFYLKYVALETHTVCNQSCYFCPVSVDPREAYFMPDELFESIVRQLTAYRPTLEGLFLMSYNEPTVDRRFVSQCRSLIEARLPLAVNSNGSGLTPATVDALVEAGSLHYLSINLSTLDPDRYREDRGRDQLDLVLRHLDYAKDRPVARQMVIMVLGDGDDAHRREIEAARDRFAGSLFEVQSGRLMDRAGYLQIGLGTARREPRLCGCENVGSRPLQHLHVTPHGKCVLCCEDYDERYVVGDLTEQTVAEVLVSDRFARYRRWAYGAEEAPADFMCRKCIFARKQ